MNSIVDIDNYKEFDFHCTIYDLKRPLCFTTQHIVYPLQLTERGSRQFYYDSEGNTISNPR